MDSLGKIEVALGVFPARDGAPAWPAKGGDPQAVAQWSGARLRLPPAAPPELAKVGQGPKKSGHPKKSIFSKMRINRSREGLRCEPMGRYSEKSTYQGSAYILIALQELLEATFDETRGRNSTPKKVPRAKRPIFRRLRLTAHGRVLGASPWAHIRKSLHFEGLSTSS